MSKRTVCSVDCEIPGGLSEFIDFESKTSLLDWHIILFNPSMISFVYSNGSYQGKPCLNDDRSFRLREAADHWRHEIAEAFRAGKTIFIFLPQFQEVFVDTGKREYSGTGRNRRTTRIVASFNNYHILPIQMEVKASEGKGIKLAKEADLIGDYWREFVDYSEYKVLISGNIGTPLLTTKTGAKTVGSLIQSKETRGALVLLPYLHLGDEEFLRTVEEGSDSSDESEIDDHEEEVWTETGRIFGKKLLKCLIGIDKVLKVASATTPPPNWVGAPRYVLPKEATLRVELLKVEDDLQELTAKKVELKTRIVHEGALRSLLYEKGTALELAILQALKLLGFKAEPYRDKKSEFDAVFESAEGRLLGEAEGKDNNAVNVDKLRQLEMNIHEDFERDGVTDVAKGVLFGNAYRLHPLAERGEYFTEKCMTAAKRNGTALVRTPDLFRAAQYLSDQDDQDFAKKCRQAILTAKGEIVSFPDISSTGMEAEVKEANDGDN